MNKKSAGIRAEKSAGMSRKISGAASGATLAALSIPALTMAQTTNNLCDLAQLTVYYFNIAIELIIGLAIVVFVFNIYRYFFTNRENNSERGMYLLWSIIGFFVIVSFWGLVNLVAHTFNLNNSLPSGYGNVFGNRPTGSPCTHSGGSANQNVGLPASGNSFTGSSNSNVGLPASGNSAGGRSNNAVIPYDPNQNPDELGG